jgi:hypothetical protein
MHLVTPMMNVPFEQAKCSIDSNLSSGARLLGSKWLSVAMLLAARAELTGNPLAKGLDLRSILPTGDMALLPATETNWRRVAALFSASERTTKPDPRDDVNRRSALRVQLSSETAHFERAPAVGVRQKPKAIFFQSCSTSGYICKFFASLMSGSTKAYVQ